MNFAEGTALLADDDTASTDDEVEVNDPVSDYLPLITAGDGSKSWACIQAAWIKPAPDGTLQISPEKCDGFFAAPLLGVEDRNLDIVDFVAWRLGKPWEWWLRRGTQTPILGAANLEAALQNQVPIKLYDTPEAWATHGGIGVAILQWDVDFASLFDDLPEIDCGTNDHLIKRFSAALRARSLPRSARS